MDSEVPNSGVTVFNGFVEALSYFCRSVCSQSWDTLRWCAVFINHYNTTLEVGRCYPSVSRWSQLSSQVEDLLRLKSMVVRENWYCPQQKYREVPKSCAGDQYKPLNQIILQAGIRFSRLYASKPSVGELDFGLMSNVKRRTAKPISLQMYGYRFHYWCFVDWCHTEVPSPGSSRQTPTLHIIHLSFNLGTQRVRVFSAGVRWQHRHLLDNFVG